MRDLAYIPETIEFHFDVYNNLHRSLNLDYWN